MINILRLSATNFDEILQISKSAQKSEFLASLSDCFLYAPHKVDIISRLVISLCTEDPEYIQDIKDLIISLFKIGKSIDCNISLLIYCKSLSFNIPQIEFKEGCKVLDNEFFKSESIDLNDSSFKIVEYNEYLNNLEIFLSKIGRQDVNEIFLFKIISIIKNYQFDIYDCLDELKKMCDFYEELLGILYLCDTRDFFLINLILRSLHDKEGVDSLFKILPFMNKPFRDLLISFIYEYFINKRVFKHSQDVKFLFDTPEEISEIKKYIDEETVREMMKYVSIQSLEAFVPEFKNFYEVDHIIPLKKEDFIKKDDKKSFYRDFCLLGSPSITHFLSYLEIYKEDMKMTEEDEKIFMEVFDDVFKNRESYKRIVIGKMQRFKFLKGEYV